MQEKRIQSLDVAKGIGIILVVAGHLIGEGGISFIGSSFLHRWIYSFHMPLFFVISGILLGKSLNREYDFVFFKEKCKKIVWHLGGVYFVWSVIYFILSHPMDFNGYIDWIECIFSFRGRAPVWFVGGVMWAQLFFVMLDYVLLRNGIHREVYLGTIFIILLIVSVLAWYIYRPLTGPFWGYVKVAVFRETICLFFLCSGFIVSNTVLKVKEKLISFLLFIVPLICSLLICKYGNVGVNLHTYNISNIWVFMLTGLLGSISILYLSKIVLTFSSKLKFRWLQLLGRDSMGIMLLHYTWLPFMNYAAKVCDCLNVTGLGRFLVSLLVVVLFSAIGTELIKEKLFISN